MIKVRKGNVYYNIPDNHFLAFKYRGFELVDNGEIKDMVDEADEKEEAVVEEVIESEEYKEVYEPMTIKDLLNYKKQDLIKLAIKKGISITGDEHIGTLRSIIVKYDKENPKQ